MHRNFLTITRDLEQPLAASQGCYLHAWLLTALATPYPIVLDFAGVRRIPQVFWQASLGALTTAELTDLWSRVTFLGLTTHPLSALRWKSRWLHTPRSSYVTRHVG